MATETPNQHLVLERIATLAAEIDVDQNALNAKRAEQRALFAEAKAKDISSYSISKAANISQPRVQQILKTLGGPALLKKPSAKKHKELLDENAALKQQLAELTAAQEDTR